MASVEDAMLQFREDAIFAIHASTHTAVITCGLRSLGNFAFEPLFLQLIADALYRCTRQIGATRIDVKICCLSPSSTPSLSPMMFLLSVAHSGPCLKISEIRKYFPQFITKSSYAASSTQLSLRWGGVVRVLTADVGEKGFFHYEIRVRPDNGFETTKLPRAEDDTELVRGVVNEIIVAGSVHELVDFAKSICEKTSMLKLKNVTLDFFLQSTQIDDEGHHIKGLRIFDGTSSLEDFSAEELLCVGAIEYLSSRCGFSEGSPSDLRFRQLVQVGKGQAGSTTTKWSLDACVVLIDMAAAEEIFATTDSQTSVVAYFENGCYTSAPVSVLKGLNNVKWSKFGLKIKELLTASSGEVIIQFEEPKRFSAMFMALHIHQNLRILQRSHSPPGGTMVKAAVEACLTDLKSRYSEPFLSENAIQMQQVATDVSECIASMITSSTNEDFIEECASIVQLPLHNLEEMEIFIRMKMFKIIQQRDELQKKKPRENTIEDFTLQPESGEDEEFLYYDYEDPEFL